MKISRLAEALTVLSFQGGWMKLAQVHPEGDSWRLLGMKAKRVEGFNQEQTAQTLKEMLEDAPAPAKEAVGLLPKGEVLTRYLVLPSSDPEELRAMALYQLEGTLPYPAQECVVSVKALGPVGEGTRVLAVVSHRSSVERLIQICRQAGLELSGISISSEAVSRWHKACWPSAGQAPPAAWLAVEVAPDGLDVGVLAQGKMVYMRQVPHPPGSLDQLVASIQETSQAYAREQIGPAVEMVTVSGSLERYGAAPLERLEAVLQMPVHRVDPLEASPFREALAAVAQEIGASEISFSELLGAACGGRLLELDLLPAETRLRQEKARFALEVRRSVVLGLICAAVVLGWFGLRFSAISRQLRQSQAEIRLLEAQTAPIRAAGAQIRTVAAARQAYGHEMALLSDAMERLPSGTTIRFLGLESGGTLTVRGSAPGWTAVNEYASSLRSGSLWGAVALRSAKTQSVRGASSVDFEMVLQVRGEGKGESST